MKPCYILYQKQFFNLTCYSCLLACKARGAGGRGVFILIKMINLIHNSCNSLSRAIWLLSHVILAELHPRAKRASVGGAQLLVHFVYNVSYEPFFAIELGNFYQSNQFQGNVVIYPFVNIW